MPPLLYQLVKKLSEQKIPFIFDLQDYYPTSATGYIFSVDSMPGTIAKGFFETITRFLIKSANAVTVPGIALANYAKRVGARRVYIIPNGISEHFLKLYDGKEIRKKLSFDINDIVVGYIGSIEFWLDMKPMIKGIAKAHSKGIPVKLLLIGKRLQTAYPRKVKKWIKKYGIEKITTWLGFIPHEEVPKYIAVMNIGTIPFNVNNLTAYYAVPNKMWEFLSQQKPVIATPIPEAIANRDYIDLVKGYSDYFKIITMLNQNRYDYSKVIKGYAKARRLTWKRSTDNLKELLIGIKNNSSNFQPRRFQQRQYILRVYCSES